MELYMEEPESKECRRVRGQQRGNATTRPEQTKVTVGAGHGWLEERLTPTREACERKGS